jgi:Nop14-like family
MCYSTPLYCSVITWVCVFSIVDQRKETLLVEYKKLGRGNKFVDKRIGERDATMPFDEKMAKRFALERQVKF